MAEYPSGVYSPRTKENKSGVVYAPAKKTVGFAEDFTKLDDEVVAIETELGTEPKWSSASIKERLKGIRSLSNATQDIITIKEGYVGVGTDSPINLFHLKSSKVIVTMESGDTADIEFQMKNGAISKAKWGWDHSEDVLKFNYGPSFGAVNHLVIASSGNIGIGTTSPLTKLSIQGTAGTDLMNVALPTTGASALYVVEDGNVGIGTTSPDEKLQVVGTFKSGDDNTNYLLLAADGSLTLIGTARVKRYTRVGAGAWNGGVSAPSQGFDGAFVYLEFDNSVDDEAFYVLPIPARWDNTTDIEFAIDWYYTGAQDNGTVCWGLEYKSIKAGEAVTGGGTIIAKTSAGNHTTGQMVRTTFTVKLLAANLERGDTIGLRVFRDVDGGNDSGDTLATNARGLNTHFRFIMNRLGDTI